MTPSSPSLPAGEDLQHSSRRSAKGLLLRFLVREGVQLSTTELVAIAHALGEVAIANTDCGLCGSLDTIGVDASGHVHLHTAVASSEPAVDAIKRELARLAPVARDPLALRRILAMTGQGAEQYLDRLAALSEVQPREVLAELVGRWMSQYARAWSMADEADDATTEIPDASGPRPEAVSRFGRQRARHGAEIPGDWAGASHVPWQERRRVGEPLAECRDWMGRSRVLLFVGEEIPGARDTTFTEDVVGAGSPTSLDGEPRPLAPPPVSADWPVGSPVPVRTKQPHVAPVAVSDHADGWLRARQAVEGVRRTMLRYARSHSPFGASQPS